MRAIHATETRKPGQPRMNLDVGRLTLREAGGLAALAVGALFVGTLGGLITWGAGPHNGEGLGELGGFRFWLLLFGLAVAIVGWGLAVAICYLTITDWLEYRVRLNDWHHASLTAFENAGGIEIEQQLTLWDLTANHPLHVLAVAISVARRVEQGTPAAWSTRQLEGPVFLGGVRLGEVNGQQAEAMGKMFADLGLVTGREKRKAGEWAAADEREVIRLVSQNWHRVSGGPAGELPGP